tara:strand:+ start:193 stop:372 length:180 start_codon:yes stop_codon:yes gene_type:complete
MKASDGMRTGQTYRHNDKGYTVKVTYINRARQVVVEECETGQNDGFGKDFFLSNFTLIE